MSSVVHRPVAGRVAAIGAAFAVLIALLAVPGAVPAAAASCPSASTSANYSGGAGTDGNPWQIATAADLLRLADPAQSPDWSGYFLQTADIDMAGCDWTPIAFTQDPWDPNQVLFTGTYDGGGRQITNMSFDQDNKSYVGLFGLVDGGTIENLRLQIKLRGDVGTVGGLVGMVLVNGVTVRNVRAEVDIDVADGNAGGLIGEGAGPILIERSRVSGSLTAGGTFYIGGLIGLYYGSAPAELVVRDSVSSASLASTSSRMNLGGVLGSTSGSARITGTTIDGSLSGAGSFRYDGFPPGTIDPPVVTTGVGGVIGILDNPSGAAIISDVEVRASGIEGVEAVGGIVGHLQFLDSLVIERTVVRSPVSASLEFGECLVGLFTTGTEERTTVVDSFSRSTVSVAGVVSQCPFPPDPEPAGPSFVAPSGVVPQLSPGVGEWVQADGSSTPLTVSSPGLNQVRYEADGLRLTFTGGAGSDASRGLVANPAGEVVCEVCVELAAGGVIEAWMFSEPRLVAAWRIEDLPCQTFAIPVVAPLDGGGPVSAGAHTLQLALPTASGMQAVNVGVTVGGPVPARVPAGEGPAVPAGLLLVAGLAAAAFGLRRLAVGTAA